MDGANRPAGGADGEAAHGDVRFSEWRTAQRAMCRDQAGRLGPLYPRRQPLLPRAHFFKCNAIKAAVTKTSKIAAIDLAVSVEPSGMRWIRRKVPRPAKDISRRTRKKMPVIRFRNGAGCCFGGSAAGVGCRSGAAGAGGVSWLIALQGAALLAISARLSVSVTGPKCTSSSSTSNILIRRHLNPTTSRRA
jgi:hypothetical protein